MNFSIFHTMRFNSTATAAFKKLTLSEFTFFQFLLALNSIIFHWLYPKITVESCFGYIQMIFVHIFLCRLMSWLAFFGYRKRGFTKSYALFFIRKFWYHFFFVVSNYYFGIFFQFSGRKIVVVEIVWQRSTHT